MHENNFNCPIAGSMVLCDGTPIPASRKRVPITFVMEMFGLSRSGVQKLVYRGKTAPPPVKRGRGARWNLQMIYDAQDKMEQA